MARNRSCLYEKYIWEVPVRVTHWVNVIAIMALSVTGFYIGSPRTLGTDPADFVMGWVRVVHLTAGYTFAVSIASRIWWAFAGNRPSGWREFVPFLYPEGRRDMGRMFLYYIFLSRKVPHPLGHNALAGATYLLVFSLYLVMVATGFALDAQHEPGGVMYALLAPLYALFGNQGLRLAHHMGMWLLLGFAIHHIYSAWLMDVKERGGVMSSIFGGYKPVKRGE